LSYGSFRVAGHFNGHAIESLVDAAGNSMVLATGLIGGNLPGIIAGGNGDETLDGRGGDDFLFGNNGHNELLGGDGDDLLAGGRGDDVLTGGTGADTFVFGKSGGADTVTDFELGVDHLRLDDDLSIKSVTTADVDHSGATDAIVHFSNGS